MNVNIHVDSVITSLADVLVHAPYRNQEKTASHAIVCTVRVNVDQFGYMRDGNTHIPNWEGHACVFAHFIITAGKNVFYASDRDKEDSVFDWKKIPLNEWQNTSNHDSCWRSDGFSEFRADANWVYDQAMKNIPQERRKEASPASWYTSIGTSLGTGAMFEFVRVEHSPVSMQNTYRRQLDSVERVQMKLIEESELQSS